MAQTSAVLPLEVAVSAEATALVAASAAAVSGAVEATATGKGAQAYRPDKSSEGLKRRGTRATSFKAPQDSLQTSDALGPEMNINLELLKTERDQAKSKMIAAVREANEAAEQYIVNRNAYDEWQAKKNESSVAMAEFGKANIAYLNALRHGQSWERDQATDSAHGAVELKTETNRRTR